MTDVDAVRNISDQLYQILEELQLKAVGLDPQTMKMQEGYFVSFRDIALPIRSEEFMNPWTPNRVPDLSSFKADLNFQENTDPKDAVSPVSTDVSEPETSAEDAEDRRRAEAGRSIQAFINTHNLTNQKLQMSNRYSVMPGSGSVFDSWFAIITGAHGIPGKLEISPELQAAFDEANAILVDDGYPSRAYEEYLKYEEEYEYAFSDYTSAFTEAQLDSTRLRQWPMTGAPLMRRVEGALDKWMGFGKKAEIERALSITSSLGADPAMALIRLAKQHLTNRAVFEFHGYGRYPLTTIIPNGWADERDSRGWMKFAMTQQSKREESSNQDRRRTLAGKLKFPFGFWTSGPNVESSEEVTTTGESDDDLSISFEYMVADVRHEGIRPSLLNLGNWFLYGDYPKHSISDGTFNQELPQNGVETVFLPSIITGLILIKNLKITSSAVAKFSKETTKDFSVDGRIGYGPFVLGGVRNDSRGSNRSGSDLSKGELSSSGVQLLGYVSQILPASPKVDSSEYMKKIK